MSRFPKVNGWNVFVPVDPEATCFACGRSWLMHGTASNHCPPCSKEVKQGKYKDLCNKISGHKGACAVVPSRKRSKKK